jgi:integrase
MKIYKRFTNDADAEQHGKLRGQTIPAKLEDKFPESPYWVRFVHNGERYTTKLDGAHTRRDAEKMAKTIYARIVGEEGKYRHLQGTMPFSTLLERYLEENRSKPSYDKMEQRAKRLVEFFAETSIAKIRRQDAIKFREQLRKETTRRGQQRSNADTNRYLQLLRGALNFAVLNEWLAVNPLARANLLLTENKGVPRFFTDEEIERILTACYGELEYYRPMIEFCLLTGCRTREMLLLTWDAVDFEGSRIHFHNTKTKHDRFVIMSMELRRLLSNLPRLSEYVFPNPKTGQPYGHFSERYGKLFPQFPRKAWEMIRKRAGLTDTLATPYTFRRTAATVLAKSLGLHEAAEILGHADIKTTMIYAKVVSETYNQAAEILETKLRKANGGER